jgi:PAS domain S-box-containing protein
MNELSVTTAATSSGASPADAETDAIDGLPLPYIEMDAKGIITRANRATLALHPLEHGTLVGTMAWDLMATDEKEPSCAAYLSFMEPGPEPGQDPPPVLRSLYTRGGEFRICELHRNLMRDSQGRPIGMRMMLVDVTQAKKDLEEAHRVRNWLESIVESAADALIVTDALGFIRVVNPAAEQLFGWKANELIGRVIEKGLPLLNYASEKGTELSFTMGLAGPCKGIATILGRERREVRVEIVTSPIVDKSTGYTTGVVSVLRGL